MVFILFSPLFPFLAFPLKLTKNYVTSTKTHSHNFPAINAAYQLPFIEQPKGYSQEASSSAAGVCKAQPPNGRLLARVVFTRAVECYVFTQGQANSFLRSVRTSPGRSYKRIRNSSTRNCLHFFGVNGHSV